MEVEGFQVISGRVNVPQFGAISGELEVNGEIQAGAISINENVSMAAVQVSEFAGRYYVSIEGGGGSLSGMVAGKHFRNATAKQVLEYIVKGSDEKLSKSIKRSLTRTKLSFYTLYEGTRKACLGDLARLLGVDWRTLYDGSVWLGTGENDPADPELELLNLSPSEGVAQYAGEFNIQAGQELAVGVATRVVFEVGHMARVLVWV